MRSRLRCKTVLLIQSNPSQLSNPDPMLIIPSFSHLKKSQKPSPLPSGKLSPALIRSRNFSKFYSQKTLAVSICKCNLIPRVIIHLSSQHEPSPFLSEKFAVLSIQLQNFVQLQKTVGQLIVGVSTNFNYISLLRISESCIKPETYKMKKYIPRVMLGSPKALSFGDCEILG